MENLWIAVFIVGGLVAAVLAVLLMRGRFGTATEQADFDLGELARSEEIPDGVILKAVATCRGHDLSSRQILGAGVLWLTPTEIGFVLRNPRRHIRISRQRIERVELTSSFHRPGIEERSDAEDFVVVRWANEEGTASIVWQLPEPEPWMQALSPEG